jgi:Sigma-70, region 4
LSRLPDKYRTPLVLCDLEGKTRKEAARQLGWRDGTLSWRLAKARGLLAERLTRRGIALSGGVLSAALARSAASASVPAPLVARTVEAATLLAGSATAAGVISAKVLALTEGVLKTMFMTKLKMATTAALIVAVIGTGAGGYAYRLQAADEPGVHQKGEFVAQAIAQAGQQESPKQNAEAQRLRKAVEDAVKQLTKALEDDARTEAKRAYERALQDHRPYLVKNCTICHQLTPHVKEDPHREWRLQFEQYVDSQRKAQVQDKSAKEATIESISNAVEVLKKTTKDAPTLETLKEIENAVKKLRQGLPPKK